MAKGKVDGGKLVLIGGSAGSLEVLLQLIPALKTDFACPIVIVVHRKTPNDSTLADLLSTKTLLKVKEIEEKDKLKAGHIYIAPGDYHVLFEKDATVSLDYSEKVNFSRPSIDVAFQSAADAFAPDIVCILLSGASSDGTIGFRYVKSRNGVTIAQLPSSAEVAYMPEQAILSNSVDRILDAQEIADFINQL